MEGDPLARARTPLAAKITLAAMLVGVPGLWLADHLDRQANERRLGEVASAIAGRDVEVHCPGPLKRVFGYEIADGSVRFGADGKPADETDLRHEPCTELDALADGERKEALSCVTTAAAAGCGAEADRVARAVDVLAHESWHLAGETDEAMTECRALQTIAWAAQRLGASEADGRSLARHQLAHGYPRMPSRYRSAECVDGGGYDLRPDTSLWP